MRERAKREQLKRGASSAYLFPQEAPVQSEREMGAGTVSFPQQTQDSSASQDASISPH